MLTRKSENRSDDEPDYAADAALFDHPLDAFL
jgi:hypothetical protein